MFGFSEKKKDNSGWFSWNVTDDDLFRYEPCCSPYDMDHYFEKEPERDYFQDLLDLKWSEGHSDFDSLKPLL